MPKVTVPGVNFPGKPYMKDSEKGLGLSM